MTNDMELILDWDGEAWVATHEDFVVRGATLEELDRTVEERLREDGRFSKGTKVNVLMGCHSKIVPAWMRPYQWHYFNREVSFDL